MACIGSVIIQHIIIVKQKEEIEIMDDAFIDRIMDLYLTLKGDNDDNTKHNASDNVRDNGDTTDESDKPIEGESDIETGESSREEQE